MYVYKKNVGYRSDIFFFIRLLLAIFLITIIVRKMPLIASSQNLSPLSNISMKGQVQLPSNLKIPPEKLDVVLLKFVLSSEGKVNSTGPQARVKTDVKGNFEFVDITPDLKAGYQFGTRVEGVLYSSEIFFLKSGETLIQKNILIPGVSTEVEKLEAYRISLVIESGLGIVTVTEVLTLSNSSENRIDTRNNPLKQKLPEGVENFSMMETRSGDKIHHYLESNMLKIKHIFPIGESQIIYQYFLSAWFGSMEIIREFDIPLDKVEVWTPEGYLQIRSEQLIFSGKKRFHDRTFLTWRSTTSDSNELKFTIRNVPVNSLQYVGVSVVILLSLFATVVLFFQFRLNIKKLT